MTNIKPHFTRTIEVVNLLATIKSQHLNTSALLVTEINTPENLDVFINAQDKTTLQYFKQLNEIHEIEKERLTLSNEVIDIQNILNHERIHYQLREKLLTNPFEDIHGLIFVINPYVKMYESYWNWSQEDIFSIPELFQTILNTKPDDHYFILQQTGSFDNQSQNNILELPLSEYEYFLLSLFENPTTILSAIETFEKEFDYESEVDKNELRQNIKTLLTELIFRTFIIQADR